MSEPTRTVPPRPSATTEIIEACAEELALQLDCDAYTLVKHYSHPMDGYEFARELESWAGWQVRSQNADDLEDMQHLIDAKVSAAEKQWFEDNDIQPPLPIGARITCQSRNRTGIIEGVYEYGVARYLVRPEQPNEHELATSAQWIIKFEDAKQAQNELSREA